MIIRCERCSTLYELDEGLLSPEGTEVQCARCHHVFTTRSLVTESQVADAAAPPAPAPAAAAPPPAPPPEPVAAAPAAAPVPAPARAAHRPSVYRPPVSQPSQPSASRPSVLRRDTVGTFESRLRSGHRWRWLAPALLLAAGGIAAVLFLPRRGAVDAAALRAQEHALSLARADDVRSLEEAAAELDQALRAAPGLHAARADRALVDLLLAGILSDSPADKADASGRRERARTLVTGATAALEDLRKADRARPEVARALAVAASFGQSRPELSRAAAAAAGELPGDPWIAIAEATADLRSSDRTLRDRVVGDLGALVARRPDALRARYLLARGQLLAGRRAEAVATVEALLLANPRHEGALGLREALGHGAAIGSAGASTASAAAADAGRTEKPAALPRKADSTEGEAPAPAPSEPTVAADAPRSALEHPSEGEATPAEPATSAGAEATPATEPPPAPRLRPAAVPEPEPVGSGG